MEEAYLWAVREVGGMNDDANDSDRPMAKASATRAAMHVERGSMVSSNK